MILKTSIVKEQTKEAMLDALVSVMSDEDSNGNNGLEYLWEDARAFWGLPKNIAVLPITEDLSRYTNDNYLRELGLKMNVSLEELANFYYKMYNKSVISYYRETEFILVRNENNEIQAVSFGAVD